MRDLPVGWTWRRFSDVAKVASDLVDPAEYLDMPHIAPNHIESQTGRLLPFTTVQADGVTSPKHRFRSGQVLYSKIRPYLAKVVLADFEGLCSADMYPIDTDLDPKFLKWWMLTPDFTRRAAGEQARTVLPKINRRALSQLPVPTPPMTVQRRIVEILEDHLSRLDAANDYVTASAARSKTLIRSVITSLVPDVTRYPAHWEMKTVATAGRVDLGRQRHPDWHTGPNMKPYLRVANVFEDRIDTRDVKEMHWPEGTFERFRLAPGDVLLNEGQTPDLLGRPALYRGELGEVAFTNSLLRFRAFDDVLPEFALLVFRRHMHARRFKRESRITTNIAHLSAARLKPIEFPVPPLEEQKRIVFQADEELSQVGALQASIAEQTRRAATLRRAILAAAFSGRLTGHRTDDEVIEEKAGA